MRNHTDFFDEFFNVYEYLQQVNNKDKTTTKDLLNNLSDLIASSKKTSENIDDSLNRAYKIAEELGIDTTDLKQEYSEKYLKINENNINELNNKKIELREDYDFQDAFKKLCDEAHDAGFSDVKATDVLSEDEIRMSLELEKAIDICFMNNTSLTSKDLIVLVASVVVRVVCFFIIKLFMSKKANNANVAEPVIINSEIENMNSTDEIIDLGQGLDFSRIIEEANEITQKIPMVRDGLNNALSRGIPDIRTETNILNDILPFDIEDATPIHGEKIAGNDKHLGWVFGVMKILTGTLTTCNFQSYSVTPSFSGKNIIDGQISTILNVIQPVIKKIPHIRNSIVAATIKEAECLGYVKASHDDVNLMFTNAVELEKNNNVSADKIMDISKNLKIPVADNFVGFAFNSFIDIVVTSIHAVFYSADECDLNQYIIRTNKIKLYSNAIAASINSIPALATKDISKLDFSGILNTCLNLFNSTRFWIDVKAQFLSKEYTKRIDEELSSIEGYFVYT